MKRTLANRTIAQTTAALSFAVDLFSTLFWASPIISRLKILHEKVAINLSEISTLMM